MRRHLLAACPLALLAAAAPAHAVPPPVLSTGGCNHVAPVQDYYPYDDGRHYTLVDSDPVYVGDGPAVLTCTVQIGRDLAHAGADTVAVSSPASFGVVMLPPATVVYDVDDWFSFCTSVSIEDGPTYYRDGDTGRWSTDPGVRCWTPPAFGPPPQEVTQVVPGLARFLAPYAGSTACPVLADSPVLRDENGPVWVEPDGDTWVGGLESWFC